MADDPVKTVKADNTLQKDVVLNHIDKLYATLTKIWEGVNRILLIQTLLTVMLIILCTGYVSVDEVSLAGIKFKISFPAILSLGAAFVTMLHFAFLFQWEVSVALRGEIIRLYESINYKTDESHRYEVRNDAFSIPNVYMSAAFSSYSQIEDGKGSSLYRTILGFACGLFVLFVPTAVQIVVGLKVATLYEWAWWIIAIFVLLIVFTVVGIVAHIKSEMLET